MTEKESLIDWLEWERRKQNGTLEAWKIGFLTDGFYIKLSGGEETKSEPPSFLEHISQYSKIVVQLFNRGSAEDPKWDPLTIGEYTFNFNVKIFPHVAISPSSDLRFKNQPWASKFDEMPDIFGEAAILTLEEFSLVLEYLVRIDALAAFL